MEILLADGNIVILAKNFNPSIISRDWIIQNKIIEEEIVNFAHLPMVSIIETVNFNLIVDQDKLQLSVKKINEENIKALPQTILKYLNKLPETPYKAIGFNYSYRVRVDQKKIKRGFLINDDKFRRIFTEDYMFGGMFKFKLKDFVVILAISPVSETETGGDFNFHFASDSRDDLAKKLFEHSEMKKKAESILGGLFDELEI